LDKYRLTPLPPYIKQDESLSEDYQTVYADPVGSKAAPTAGLHFTDEQLSSLAKDHPIAKLTLHVGLGTFAPVKAENIDKHKMHFEDYLISEETAGVLNKAKSITAVGTTSLRVLETLGPAFRETSGSTDIFIKPGYKFKSVDSLVTNFHLPKSTLLMLVAAFMDSVDEMHRVYAHAIDNKYRFYSFGDAMLIL
jgi:S-adenosylmethionine:tRNA ribosyltransferase-isomerase